ncbi:MAG: ATPase domain-containing protein, partial [Thermoplasmata archaeon]
MFRNSIKSLKDVFENDVMPGAVILVAGPPGSMKSTFIYSVLSSYLENTGNYGIYMTLEQSKDSLLNHMRGMGIRGPENLYT